MSYVCRISSPVGLLTLASDGENITGLWIEGQKYYASTLKKEEVAEKEGLAVFEQTKDWLNRYFTGVNPGDTPPLAPGGSEFRQSVFRILREIPYGQIMTYGQIAKRLVTEQGKHGYAQAVGGAVGHNPISILIPCHRVVGSNGSLTGYAGGIDIKIKLLQLEGAPLKGLSAPAAKGGN